MDDNNTEDNTTKINIQPRQRHGNGSSGGVYQDTAYLSPIFLFLHNNNGRMVSAKKASHCLYKAHKHQVWSVVVILSIQACGGSNCGGSRAYLPIPLLGDNKMTNQWISFWLELADESESDETNVVDGRQ